MYSCHESGCGISSAYALIEDWGVWIGDLWYVCWLVVWLVVSVLACILEYNSNLFLWTPCAFQT